MVALNLKWLLGIIGMGDKLIRLNEYEEKLCTISRDKLRFIGIKGNITWKEFMEASTFHKYTDVDETYRKLIKFSIPSEYTWEKLC